MAGCSIKVGQGRALFKYDFNLVVKFNPRSIAGKRKGCRIEIVRGARFISRLNSGIVKAFSDAGNKIKSKGRGHYTFSKGKLSDGATISYKRGNTPIVKVLIVR